MNRLKLSFIATAMLLVVGCGGGGSSSSNTAKVTKVESIEDAKSSYQSLSALDNLDGLSSQLNNSKLQKTSFSKGDTYTCDNGGKITLSVEGSTTTIVGTQCQYGTSYINGTMSMTYLADGSEKFNMSNLTLKDGDIEMSISQMVFVDNETEHWATMDGDIKIVSKCFSGTYNFTTIEKMYEAQDGTYNVESGVFELNGARYTFSNPTVTIKVGETEETILQSELEQRIDDTTTCSE